MKPKWSRDIRHAPAAMQTTPSETIDSDAVAWLQQQAARWPGSSLLAHADDGMIWGYVNDQGQLLTSYDAAQGDVEASQVCPPLRFQTLQQARLFDATKELLLWRDGDNCWRAREIRDVKAAEPAEWNEAFDEPQLLWGTHGRHLPHSFTLLSDGAQGLRHAVPARLPLKPDGQTTPPRLIVRHYITPNGFTRVVASRLVGLEMENHQ